MKSRSQKLMTTSKAVGATTNISSQAASGANNSQAAAGVREEDMRDAWDAGAATSLLSS